VTIPPVEASGFPERRRGTPARLWSESCAPAPNMNGSMQNDFGQGYVPVRRALIVWDVPALPETKDADRGDPRFRRRFKAVDSARRN